MRPLHLFIVLLSVFNPAAAQPPGIDDSIMNIKTKWGRRGDAYNYHGLPKNDYVAAPKQVEKISLLFKEAYPQPTGIDAAWYGSMENRPLFKGGPTPYSFRSLYMYYYYNTAYKKIIPVSETGTVSYVYVNHPSWFLVDSKMKIDINGSPVIVYQFPVETGTWNGYTLYRSMYNDNSCMVAITKDGKVPWKPISQLQYLNGLRAIMEKERNDQIKASPQLQQKINDFFDKEVRKIDSYLNNSNESTLSQQAAVRSWRIFNGKFPGPTEKNVYKLVYIDTTYFNKSLPTHLPQLMVLYWSWNKNAPAFYFKKQLEENFPIEKLKAMLSQ